MTWRVDTQARTGLSGCVGVQRCTAVEGCADASRFVNNENTRVCQDVQVCVWGTLVCEDARLDHAVALYEVAGMI